VNDIAPGWYKDPAEPATQRYWDGDGWLGDPLPIDATPPAGPPAVAAATVAPAATVTLPPPMEPPATKAPAPPTAQATAPARVSAPPVTAPPHGPPGAPVPPGIAWPPGAPGATWPPGTAPPGTAPPGTLPPGAAGAGWPPGTPPPGAFPPGTIPWPAGVPAPPGYRVAYPFAPAAPLPHGLPVAPLGRRLLARLIDIGIVLGLNALATGWLVYLFLRDYLPLVRAVAGGQPFPATPGRVQTLAYLIPAVAMLVWLAYEVPALAASGQTVGKRALGIKVMALESTGPLGFRRALRRWGVLGWPTVLWVCGLGFVVQFIDALSPTWGGPLQLALHDRSAQTVVVHCGRRGHEITPVNAPGKTGEL
jgi:uncharacterized RDD family membrane protein YckC